MTSFTAGILLCMLSLLSHLHAYVLQAATDRPPDSKGIICWTCPNKTNNEKCNNWAPNILCPTNHTVCLTLNRFVAQTGRSVLVNKVCVLPQDCTKKHVGCKKSDKFGHTECVSCCNESYCNEHVALNSTTAMQLSASVVNSAAMLDVRWEYSFTLLVLSQLFLKFNHVLRI